MPSGVQPQVTLETKGFGGVNNALQFSQLPREQSPLMQNAYMSKIGAIAKRPGTRPVTTTALANTIEHLTTYKASAVASSEPEIFASSGTTLYKYNGSNALTALTMTNPLNDADIYTVGFTNALLTSRLIIGDSGILKGCNGSVVADVTPAVDAPLPNPANVLTDINAKGHKFIWTHSSHIFSSPGTNELFYSKRFEYDYWPETQYFYLVNENDYINGCGVTYDGRCLIPLRRSWAILTGSNFDDFEADEYLNTNHGVIAPRSVQKVTYPDGSQTIIYLSDDEVHEVFTAIHNETSKMYATRSLMRDIIDFGEVGLTESEKETAVGFFDASRSLYLLSFKKDGENFTYAYDLRNREWYTDWTNFNARSYVSLDSVTYFAGELKHLCKFDNDLYSDWEDSAMTTGSPIYFKRYSPLLSLENTGYASYWDYLIIELKQYPIPSSLDVTVIFTQSSELGAQAIDTSSAVWDETEWDVAEFANEDYTETVNEPRRIKYMKKSKYVQELWENNADQPVEVYWSKWIGRVSGT